MRTILLIAILSVIGSASECWAQQNQPSSQNSFVCDTAESAEQLNARLSRDGLVAKGVQQMTAYCVADIGSLWKACAKSHGAAKRNFWCGQLTSHCKELSRQNEAIYQARLAEKAKKDNEREKARLWRMQNLPPEVNLMMPYESSSLSELLNIYSREPAPSECSGVPDEEGKKPPQSASAYPPVNRAMLEMMLNTPTPSPYMNMPSQPSFGSYDDTPAPRIDFGSSHSNTCTMNKMNCMNGCNPPSYGQPKDFDAIGRCRASCERMCQ